MGRRKNYEQHQRTEAQKKDDNDDEKKNLKRNIQ